MGWQKTEVSSFSKGTTKDEEVCIITLEQAGFFGGTVRFTFNKLDWETVGKHMDWKTK